MSEYVRSDADNEAMLSQIFGTAEGLRPASRVILLVACLSDQISHSESFVTDEIIDDWGDEEYVRIV
jgi:hypothetical protein